MKKKYLVIVLLFLVANTYPKGSQEFIDVWLILAIFIISM